MDILKDIVTIFVCIVALGKGAAWLVNSATAIAKRFGISELVIGLTIVAFGTSAPEFGVTILAALKDIGDISVGNIVGSNIFNLGFILGGTAIIHNLKTDREVFQRDGIFLLFGTILLMIFLWNLNLAKIEGIILFSLLFIYIAFLYWNRAAVEVAHPSSKDFHPWRYVLLLVGFGMVAISSHFLVESAIDLAKVFGVSEWIIGVTIVAAGTSAPEFATSVVAAVKGHHGLSVGNLIGSDIFNMFGVLGLASIIRTLSIDLSARSSLIALIFMVALVLLFIRTGWVISRREGFILVAIGLGRWTFDFLSK